MENNETDKQIGFQHVPNSSKPTNFFDTCTNMRDMFKKQDFKLDSKNLQKYTTKNDERKCICKSKMHCSCCSLLEAPIKIKIVNE